MQFTPLELMERLIALVPPPRMNMNRYYGLFAANQKFRAQVVPAVEQEDVSASSKQEPATGCGHRQAWAQLLSKIFNIDVLECPRCHDRMQRLKFVTNADEIKQVLAAVGYPGDSPSASKLDCNPAA